MKDYHFEQDDYALDQTIRLDDINEELKKLEQEPPEDDLGDKDAFLDAFESEKFERTGIPEPPASPQRQGSPEEPPFFNKKTVAIMAGIAVMVAFVCFALVRGMFPAANQPEEPVAVAQSPMLLQGALAGGELIVYDIEQNVKKSIALTAETVITDEQDRTASGASLDVGELLIVGLAEDGKTAVSIDFGGGIQSTQVTGLKVDSSRRLLEGEESSFTYGVQAMFLYNGAEIDPEELEPCDVLELKGINDIVWSVNVVEYHGYIAVENKENIINGLFQLDEEEALPLEEVERIAVKEGTHTVTVSGDNIEKRTDSIFVETGEVYEYDLSKAQEKVGVLIINCNVSDYKLYINGTQVDSTVPSVLPLGEYDVVILKNGYMEWSQHVTLNTDTVSIDANLQKDLQIGTVIVSADVDGGTVYIDGKEMGITPIELNLPYGSYELDVEKSGYRRFSTTIMVSSGATYVRAELERE